MCFLFKEELFSLRAWVCSSKYHHLCAEREGSNFCLEYLLWARAPGTHTQHRVCWSVWHPEGSAFLRGERWHLRSMCRKGSCDLWLKLYGHLSQQRCSPVPIYLLKWQNLPTAFAQRGAQCLAYLPEVVVGTLARGWGGNHPLLAAMSCYSGSHHLMKPYPEDSCNRRNSTNRNMGRRRQSSFFHLSLTFPMGRSASRNWWEKKSRKNNINGHRCLIKV